MSETKIDPRLEESRKAVASILAAVGTDEFYIVRRSFGQEFGNTNSDTFLSYISMEDIPEDLPYRRQFQKACFLVAGAICNNENPRKRTHKSGTRSFESMLHERYVNETKSGKARLNSLLTTPFLKWSGFEALFANTFRYLQNKQNTSNLDYVKLLNDLRFWNAGNQKVRKEWTRVMILGERPAKQEAENTEAETAPKTAADEA